MNTKMLKNNTNLLCGGFNYIKLLTFHNQHFYLLLFNLDNRGFLYKKRLLVDPANDAVGENILACYQAPGF